jgi:hypothetical protein
VLPPLSEAQITITFLPTTQNLFSAQLLFAGNSLTSPDMVNVVGEGYLQVSVNPNGIRPVVPLLAQNFPNPFNPVTTIYFTVPRRMPTTLRVFNVLGQVVETLMSEELDAGPHVAIWDAGRFAGGVYFYRIEAGEWTATRKMLLVK